MTILDIYLAGYLASFILTFLALYTMSENENVAMKKNIGKCATDAAMFSITWPIFWGIILSGTFGMILIMALVCIGDACVPTKTQPS